MAKRKRGRRERPQKPPVATAEYRDDEGNTLVLRCALSPGTVRHIGGLEAKAAANVEDIHQRRMEMLFEHLAVSWEVAGLPLDDQKLLVGRYRMASDAERRWVQATIARHLGEHIPELG